MNTSKQDPQNNKFVHWLKTSITARMLMIGFLTLSLLIPLSFIQNLIQERSHRQSEALTEINNQWGKEILMYGPILKIPYKVYKEKLITDKNTKQTYTETYSETKIAYFFPENLNVNTVINPEQKKRGIYATAVYNSNLKIDGNFTKPDFYEMGIEANNVLWNKAKLIIKTSNVKGINSANLKVNNTPQSLTSKYNAKKNYGTNIYNLHSLETKNIVVKNTNPLNFTLEFNIKGSEKISFVPVGKTTQANIKSNWKDASFFGEFLPYNNDKITDNGFNAKWKILDINRPFSQYHFNNLPQLNDFAFGVNFIIPVDEYQKSERSSKYGFLVISLTFLIFFLIQSLSKIHIHPFQYLMIGLALTMFYTLLVSISEHSNFLKAYVIAAVSVILLITLYSKTILKKVKFPVFIGASLTALYTFIYVIIQLENYALLVGSIGLFVILAIVMFTSRKIDWSNG